MILNFLYFLSVANMVKNWNMSMTTSGFIMEAMLRCTSANVPSRLSSGVCHGPQRFIGICTEP